MTIRWRSTFSTGIHSIDQQHQELIEMINEFGDINEAKVHDSEVDDLLKRLNQYVIFHFSHEESLMDHHFIASAHRESHLKQHADFATQVQLSLTSQVDGCLVKDNLVAFLEAWLTSHILVTDMALAKLIHTRN